MSDFCFVCTQEKPVVNYGSPDMDFYVCEQCEEEADLYEIELDPGYKEKIERIKKELE